MKGVYVGRKSILDHIGLVAVITGMLADYFTIISVHFLTVPRISTPLQCLVSIILTYSLQMTSTEDVKMGEEASFQEAKRKTLKRKMDVDVS
jgi:presenilin-like A22 family membrane protease